MFKLSTASIVMLLGVSFSSQAYDVRVQPKPGETLCFKRVYTRAHLAMNPRQLLTSLYVQVTKGPQLQNESSINLPIAKVAGFSQGKRWTNVATCEKSTKGLKCFIECDGGAFTLNQAKLENAVHFKVAQDYYFPLYRDGANPEERAEADTLSLNYRDRDNYLFKLYPAALHQCEKALADVPPELSGC